MSPQILVSRVRVEFDSFRPAFVSRRAARRVSPEGSPNKHVVLPVGDEAQPQLRQNEAWFSVGIKYEESTIIKIFYLIGSHC